MAQEEIAVPRKLISSITILAFCLLMLQPGIAYAGWTDDLVDRITDRVKEILDTISNAKATIADGKIKAMIDEIRSMLQEAVNTQQDGLSDFLDGGCDPGNLSSECGRFRADLKSLVQNIQDLNNEILDFHPLPGLDLRMEDPGIQRFLDVIPGRALFPAYKVMTKLGFFDSDLLASMEDARDNLAILKVVVFDEDQSTLALSSMPGQIPVPQSCGVILQQETVVKVAGASILGIGVVARIVGAILDGISKTVFAGPVEMDGGIHGYVHGTIHQNNPHLIGAILNGAGEIMIPVGDFALNKVKFCRVEQRQENMRINQETMLANQAELLTGQRRILCAFKHNLPDECEEFVGNGFGNRGRKLENPGRN